MNPRFRRNLMLVAGLLFFLTALLSLAAPKVHAAHEGTTHTELAWDKCIIQDENDKARLQIERVSPCLNPDIKDFRWIVDVWKWSLSIVNVFAAFVLIFMAFANILYPWQTLEPFRIRQLLPTFIWGVILANASLFICRAVVTAADILMSDSGIKVSVADLYANWGFQPGLLKIGIIPAMFGRYIAVDIGELLFQLVTATIFIYLPLLGMIALSFVFYFRFALIFVLSAVSPLAFGSIIFPATRGFLTRWWDMFWKWTFGGVASYLLLYLASLVSPQLTGAGAVAGGALTTIKLIPYILSLALVYMAIMAPFKLGGAIMSTISGLTKRLGKTGWGMGVGATKFLGSKGYHYASLSAARGVTQAEKDVKSAPNVFAKDRAEARVRRAKRWHQLLRSPTIIKGGFEARKAAEEKTLKRAMAGSGLYESVAGRAAAISARKEDFEHIERDPDLGSQVGILQKIQEKHPGLTGAWLSKFSRSTPAEQEEMSRGLGLSIEEHLKVLGAYRGGLRNSRYVASQADPSEMFQAGLDADSPAAGAKAMQDFQLRQRAAAQQRQRELRQQGGQPAVGGRAASIAVATPAGPQFGVDRNQSLEAASRHLQGFGHEITPQELATMAGEHMSGGSLNRPLFHEALKQKLGLESLTGDIEAMTERLQHDLERFSSKPLDLEAAQKAKVDWAVEFDKNPTNAGKDMVQELRNEGQNLEKALDEIKGDGAQVIDAGDKEVVARYGLDVKFDQLNDKNDLRHSIQEQLGGGRALLDKLAQARQEMSRKLQQELDARPQIIDAEAGFMLNIAGEIEGGKVVVKNLSGAGMHQLTQNLKKITNDIAKAQLQTLGNAPINHEEVRKTVGKISKELAEDIVDEASAKKTVDRLALGFEALGRSVTEAYRESGGGLDGIANTLRRQYGTSPREAELA